MVIIPGEAGTEDVLDEVVDGTVPVIPGGRLLVDDVSGCRGTKLWSPLGNVLMVKIVSPGEVVLVSGMGTQVVSSSSTMLADQDVDTVRGTKLVSPLGSVVSEKNIVPVDEISGCSGTKL